MEGCQEPKEVSTREGGKGSLQVKRKDASEGGFSDCKLEGFVFNVKDVVRELSVGGAFLVVCNVVMGDEVEGWGHKGRDDFVVSVAQGDGTSFVWGSVKGEVIV